MFKVIFLFNIFISIFLFNKIFNNKSNTKENNPQTIKNLLKGYNLIIKKSYEQIRIIQKWKIILGINVTERFTDKKIKYRFVTVININKKNKTHIK